jgi:hypothetical protein
MKDVMMKDVMMKDHVMMKDVMMKNVMMKDVVLKYNKLININQISILYKRLICKILIIYSNYYNYLLIYKTTKSNKGQY